MSRFAWSSRIRLRRAGRHELEVVVEGRNAHPGHPRQRLDAKRLRVFGQDAGNSGEVVVPAGQGAQGPALLDGMEHVTDEQYRA
jgi:hypothetical protein